MSALAREFRPEPDLERIVDAFWVHDAGLAAPGSTVRVLPDGCADLVFRSRRRLSDGAPVEAELFVAGAAVRAQAVPVEPGVCFVGVRFRPGMSGLLVDADQRALAGRDTVAGEVSPALARLADRLGATGGVPGTALSVLREEVRRAAAAGGRSRPPRRVREALALLGGPARVDAVARAVGVAPRTLHRDVVAWTGLAPKTLARVLRFRAALARLGSTPPGSLARVAQELGYADQAHMAREFREFAGMPPSGL
jgi:AraC-like DNA-binding protein